MNEARLCGAAHRLQEINSLSRWPPFSHTKSHYLGYSAMLPRVGGSTCATSFRSGVVGRLAIQVHILSTLSATTEYIDSVLSSNLRFPNVQVHLGLGLSLIRVRMECQFCGAINVFKFFIFVDGLRQMQSAMLCTLILTLDAQ